MYVLIDMKRQAFWKKNNYGYTTDISDARLFTYEEAKEKVDQPYEKDLKMFKILEKDGK